jgi:hypothetical protein
MFFNDYLFFWGLDRYAVTVQIAAAIWLSFGANAA